MACSRGWWQTETHGAATGGHVLCRLGNRSVGDADYEYMIKGDGFVLNTAVRRTGTVTER
jgi:hypothetical protein